MKKKNTTVLAEIRDKTYLSHSNSNWSSDVKREYLLELAVQEGHRMNAFRALKNRGLLPPETNKSSLSRVQKTDPVFGSDVQAVMDSFKDFSDEALVWKNNRVGVMIANTITGDDGPKLPEGIKMADAVMGSRRIQELVDGIHKRTPDIAVDKSTTNNVDNRKLIMPNINLNVQPNAKAVVEDKFKQIEQAVAEGREEEIKKDEFVYDGFTDPNAGGGA